MGDGGRGRERRINLCQAMSVLNINPCHLTLIDHG
jgi:hypothetical protein